ncbi:MAG TPA: cobalt ECF transporter T component CbiQ [Stackebrandtia sp.]|jgi:cobalt/nickel transport system permease protein|uniref:cobalt ECF transporter T component CbiQ n=1 Tax=Stackebrandtia sp. TaxID=2023065 RepID=UPI002D22B97A|nr:cobalt ECF transporter T component CbiQ [Stackebrandtia sp.]HZE39664.1 cobalt ECF transporter T component CbiQ [Stackebrandtia sp.]
MGAGHAHPLYREGDSPVHRLPGEAKIAAAVGFTIVVVATPRHQLWAFGCYAVLVAAVLAAARLNPLWLLKRSLIELPFVALAVLLPFVSPGPRFVWLGMHLSLDGAYGAWNILAKATLGVWASLILAATTDVSSLLAGLERLRLPRAAIQIATFMTRYIHVLSGEAKRMRIARLSRGDNPHFLWQARAYASGVAALFLRAYERGERVYVAMLSRGYNGRMPVGAAFPPARGADWARAGVLPAAAAAIAAVAMIA